MEWTAHFTGRQPGAIGIMQRFRITLEADNYQDAHEKFWREVYTTHEHIGQIMIFPTAQEERES